MPPSIKLFVFSNREGAIVAALYANDLSLNADQCRLGVPCEEARRAARATVVRPGYLVELKLLRVVSSNFIIIYERKHRIPRGRPEAGRAI